jgi:hypothetical protein
MVLGQLGRLVANPAVAKRFAGMFGPRMLQQGAKAIATQKSLPRAGLGAGVGFLTGEGAPGGRLGGAVIGGALGASPVHKLPGVPC